MVVMISDVVWIRRGVAKAEPEEVKLDEETLKELISGDHPPETSEIESEDSEAEDGDEVKKKKSSGLRGSAGGEVEDVPMEEGEEEQDPVDKLLKDYDNTPSAPTLGMRGLAAFASNKDDPYMANAVDDELDDEEKDDFLIKPDDNLVAVAKIDKDDYTLEVYVCNEKEKDWYVHHHYILEAPPLCLEPVNYDPGSEESEAKGNLLAVGTMESTINIWDLDIVNAIEPVVQLGTKKGKKPSSRKKRDGSAQGHTDAVLCLGWNRMTKHVLASGGADKLVVLWDLDQAKPAQVLSSFDAEVQSLQWHPAEATIFATGTMGGQISVVDCRNTESETAAQAKFSAQIEKILWDHFNPFCLFAASDDGFIRYIDTRNPTTPVYEVRGHEGGCNAIALSSQVRGLLASVGLDQQVAVWKLGADSITKIHAENPGLGNLHSVAFCPDSPTLISIGGDMNDLIRTVDLSTMEPVVQAFHE